MLSSNVPNRYNCHLAGLKICLIKKQKYKVYFPRYILNIILKNFDSKKRKKLNKTSEKYLFLKYIRSAIL